MHAAAIVRHVQNTAPDLTVAAIAKMAVNFSSSDEETDEICKISHLSESANNVLLHDFESFDSKNIELIRCCPAI